MTVVDQTKYSETNGAMVIWPLDETTTKSADLVAPPWQYHFEGETFVFGFRDPPWKSPTESVHTQAKLVAVHGSPWSSSYSWRPNIRKDRTPTIRDRRLWHLHCIFSREEATLVEKHCYIRLFHLVLVCCLLPPNLQAIRSLQSDPILDI